MSEVPVKQNMLWLAFTELTWPAELIRQRETSLVALALQVPANFHQLSHGYAGLWHAGAGSEDFSVVLFSQNFRERIPDVGQLRGIRRGSM